MKLLAAGVVAAHGGGARRARRGTTHEHDGTAHDHAAAGGIEWEDDMVEVNRITTPANMRWKLVDRTTGAREPRDRLAVHRSATG